MIVSLIVLINIILLFGVIYILIKQLLQIDSVPILFFTSAVILLATLSFIYFPFLILKEDFNLLLIFLTVINLSHLYWTSSHFRKAFSSLKNIQVGNDIIPVSAILLMVILFVVHGSKYGFFDAWALWNSHAKFLYHINSWTNMFADKTYESSSDYPLMLPSVIAFFWKAINNTSFIIPILFSFFFLISLPLILYYALKDEFSNKLFAVGALGIFVIDYNFQSFSSEQCADILLSLFILMGFITYNHLRKNNIANTAYILGFICASCTWVKNEGDLFYIIFTSGLIICHYKNPNYIKKYFIGSVIPLIVTFTFKEFYAPGTAFFSLNHAGISRILSDLKNLHRYVVIVKMCSTLLIDGFWVALVFIFSMFLVNISYFKSFHFITLFLMFLGYAFIYLITPYNILWHIATSFHRIINQIYPSLIYTAVLSFGYKYPRLKLDMA